MDGRGNQDLLIEQPKKFETTDTREAQNRRRVGTTINGDPESPESEDPHGIHRHRNEPGFRDPPGPPERQAGPSPPAGSLDPA